MSGCKVKGVEFSPGQCLVIKLRGIHLIKQHLIKSVNHKRFNSELQGMMGRLKKPVDNII